MATLEYYDGSWNELDFETVKHVRRYDNFQYLDAVLPNSEKDNITANTEIRWSTNSTQYFSGITKDSGELKRNGNINIRVYGHMYHILRKETDSSIQSGLSTTNVGVVQSMIDGLDDSGLTVTFSLTTPAGATTYSIPEYSLKGKNNILIDEMTRNYAWTLYTQSDGTFYYEPIGALDSGESIDISTDNNIVENLKKNKTDDIISKVRVIGKDTNGDKITSERTLSNIGETADFGIERFERLRLDYPSDSTHIEAVADRNLQSNAEDRIKISTFWYQTNLVNEKITVSDPDNTYGIENTTYIVEKQINHYPERKTTLELSTLTDRFARTTFNYSQHRKELDRRRTRSKQVTNVPETVGDGTDGTLKADNHPHLQNNPSQTNHDHTIPLETTDTYTIAELAGSSSGDFSLSTGWNNNIFSISVISGTYDFLHCYVRVTPAFSSGTLTMAVQVDGVGDTVTKQFPTLDTSINSDVVEETFVVPVFASTSGDITLDIYTDNADTYNINFDVYRGDQQHDHTVDFTNPVDGDTANLGTAPDTNENDANVSGSTGTKDVTIGQEQEDSR